MRDQQLIKRPSYLCPPKTIKNKIKNQLPIGNWLDNILRAAFAVGNIRKF